MISLLRTLSLSIGLLAVALCATCASNASAAAVSINFSGSTPSGQPPVAPINVTGPAGIASYANWNNVYGASTVYPTDNPADDYIGNGHAVANSSTVTGPSYLTDNSGASTAVTVKYDSVLTTTDTTVAGYDGPNTALQSVYLDGGAGAPATLTIGGLTAGATYSVTIYTPTNSMGSTSSLAAYTINSGTPADLEVGNVSGGGTNAYGLASGTSAGNYYTFTGVTGPTFTLTADKDGSLGADAPIAGLSIIGTSFPAASGDSGGNIAAPEPASWLLMGLGSLGLAIYRHKRRHVGRQS